MKNVITKVISGTCLVAFSVFGYASDPRLQDNETWITLNGKVQSVGADHFTLKYDDGLVTVEMDDGDRDADAYKLIKGDKVTVSGMVDRDFNENTKIEASSVYVKNIGTTFYSSSVDEEDFHRYYQLYTIKPLKTYPTTVYGVVTDIDGREIIVETGNTDLNVDTTPMAYNPLDDEGYLKIEVGDSITAYGRMVDGFFSRNELNAGMIVKHHDANTDG